MAVRFDAAADRLTHSGSYPQTSAGWTYTAWVRIDADRNDWSTWLRTSQGGNTVATLGTDSDGTSGSNYFTVLGSATIAAPMSSPTTGVWVPVAGTRSASTGDPTTWIKPSGTGSTTSASTNLATTDVTSTPDEICIGGRGSADSSEWLNGSVAFLRVWSAELSQSEIEAEWASPVAVRATNLHSEWALANPRALASVTSGGFVSRLLATQSGGTPTATDGPSAPWGAGPYPVFTDMQFEVSANALTSASFTPANGDIIVVKAGTWSTTITPGTPSGGGQTYTLQTSESTGGFNGSAYLWTAVVSGSPGSMAVAMSAPSSSSHHWVVVEVWRNGQLAATPATMHTSTGGATASSFSLTTAANDSVISWLAYDNESTENNISVFPHVYSPRAYETGWPPAANGNGVWYSAAQQAPTAGSNGFGLSAPSTGRWSTVAIEIQKLSSGVAQGGVAGLGLGSTSTPRKVAVEGGSGAVGLASTSSPRKRAVQTGAAAVGFGSSSTPRKVAVTGGRAVFGLTSTGLQSTLVSRAVSGLLAFALGSSSTPRKVAVEGGAGAVGLASTSTPRKRAVEGGAAAVGLASTSTPRKRAVEGGVAAVGLGSSSSPRKRAAAAGRALLGLTGTGVILPPIVRGSMRAAARATAGMRAAARAVTTMRKG